MATVAAGSGTPPRAVLRPPTLAASAALESRAGEWRLEEVAAEATAADCFFRGLDAAGRHVGCVWLVPLPERWWPHVADPAAAAHLKQITIATAR